jgi:uncharacterized protein (DUF433 family)
MNSVVSTLTPSEAAVVSGVSVRDVHRVIDEHILPEDLYFAEQARSFKSQACVFISFYFRAASRLTSEERQKMIALASKLPEDGTGTKAIQDDFLTIDLSGFRKDVDDRLNRLRAAQECVISDPEILGGALVVRGTRVPVYHVAASLAAGTPMDRIRAAYPSLNLEQVELAALYAEANPQRGRPPQIPFSLPPGAKLISRRIGTITRSA